MLEFHLINLREFVKKNKIEKITNPISFDKDRRPTDDGLFSYTIFGTPGSSKRKNQWGYIDLGKHYFHPLAFLAIKAIQRNLIDCITGTQKFSIKQNGEIVPDDNGKTGIDFLYKNWEKIKFKKQVGEKESDVRLSRIKFLRSLKKDEIFTDCFLVIPAYYRDVNWQRYDLGVIEKDEINETYSYLISLANSNTDKEIGIDLVSSSIDYKIQMTLLKLYEDLVLNKVPKKTGYIKKGLLGKTVDYSVRLVISANDYSKDTPIDYLHTGIPLPYVCVLFFPFLIKELYDTFSQMIENAKEIKVYSENDKDGKILKLHDDAYLDFFPKELEKRVKLFIRNQHSRIDPVLIKCEDGKYYPISTLNSEGFSLEKTPSRSLLWIDVLYLIALNVVKDKSVCITRYPVDTVHNIMITKIAVLTTSKTIREIINGKEFLYYPYIPVKEIKVNGKTTTVIEEEKIDWLDTCQFSASYLAGLGGDYDGDTVSIRPIYTKEALDEAEKLMKSPKMLLNTSGGTIRTLKNEGVLGLYCLTKG